MNLELAEQHKLIVERCKSLLSVVLNEDKNIVTDIMNKSQLKIQNYNEENYTIIDANKTELGRFTAMVKRIIMSKYVNKLFNSLEEPKNAHDYDYLCEKEEKQLFQYEDEDDEDDYFYEVKLFCDNCKKEYNQRKQYEEEYRLKKQAIVLEFKKACDNTIFPDTLRTRKISLIRSIVVKYDPTELQKKLGKEIHNEVFSIFEAQNKELLSKYNL